MPRLEYRPKNESQGTIFEETGLAIALYVPPAYGPLLALAPRLARVVLIADHAFDVGFTGDDRKALRDLAAEVRPLLDAARADADTRRAEDRI